MRFPANRGKKAALYAGFTRGRGEVFVTVDSDSVIEPDALRHLVAPLQQDGKIGAVAGNVKVFNRHQSLIGKMQGVRFVNLDYLRAAQSRYRTVICTPGSLSAYRREALMPHLEAWLHQTFLGAPCPHSEDRALTNFILRGGYYTYYQRTAVVYTLVPETYTGRVQHVPALGAGQRPGILRAAGLPLHPLPPQTPPPAHRGILPGPTGIPPDPALFRPCCWARWPSIPRMLLKLLVLLGIGSLLNLIYYLWLERDLEFVYGVIYCYLRLFPAPLDLSLTPSSPSVTATG